MFTSARLALRLSLTAPPRASSHGAGLRQATVEPLHLSIHGRRLFSNYASASFQNSSKTNKSLPPSGSEVASVLEIECKRRVEEKRIELIESLIKAVDTCDPAQRARVIEKYNAVKQASEEYHAARQKNHNSSNGLQRSNTADGEKPMSFWSIVSFSAGGVLLGITLNDLKKMAWKNLKRRKGIQKLF